MIPLTIPELGDEEAEAAARVVRSGMLVQGEEVRAFEAKLARATARAQAIAVSSGSAALELSLRALGVGPGDEVLVPALTWPSPAHAVRAVGARAVLVDVDPAEWNVRGEALSRARTDRTRAAIVIEQFGVPARHAEVRQCLGDLPILVDAACSLGSQLDGAPSGSHGLIACTSFHPRKVLTTGEGGACLTDDGHLADTLRALRNHGQRGPGDFVCASGNYRLTEPAAAIGSAQLDKLERICTLRRRWLARYRDGLSGLPLQAAPPGAEPNGQTLGLLVEGSNPGTRERDHVIEALRAKGVGAGLLSYCLTELPQLADEAHEAQRRGQPARVASDVARRGVALPLYPRMTEETVDRVVEAVRSVVDPG